jgi:hypothetical protein
MKESEPATATRSRLLQRTKELGVDFLNHENVLWMFCPAGQRPFELRNTIPGTPIARLQSICCYGLFVLRKLLTREQEVFQFYIENISVDLHRRGFPASFETRP